MRTTRRVAHKLAPLTTGHTAIRASCGQRAMRAGPLGLCPQSARLPRMSATRKSEKPQTQDHYARWETATRWYEAFVTRDLFGDWAVTRRWGGKWGKPRGHQVDVATTEAEALAMVEQVHQRRIKRKPSYALVESSNSWQSEKTYGGSSVLGVNSRNGKNRTPSLPTEQIPLDI